MRTALEKVAPELKTEEKRYLGKEEEIARKFGLRWQNQMRRFYAAKPKKKLSFKGFEKTCAFLKVAHKAQNAKFRILCFMRNF